MTDFMPRNYTKAFQARNYVSWEKPTLIIDAAAGAKKFFQQLDGGETVENAMKGIKGGMVNPVNQQEIYTDSHLGAYQTDDDVIIDQTP